MADAASSASSCSKELALPKCHNIASPLSSHMSASFAFWFTLASEPSSMLMLPTDFAKDGNFLSLMEAPSFWSLDTFQAGAAASSSSFFSSSLRSLPATSTFIVCATTCSSSHTSSSLSLVFFFVSSVLVVAVLLLRFDAFIFFLPFDLKKSPSEGPASAIFALYRYSKAAAVSPSMRNERLRLRLLVSSYSVSDPQLLAVALPPKREASSRAVQTA